MYNPTMYMSDLKLIQWPPKLGSCREIGLEREVRSYVKYDCNLHLILHPVSHLLISIHILYLH